MLFWTVAASFSLRAAATARPLALFTGSPSHPIPPAHVFSALQFLQSLDLPSPTPPTPKQRG